MSWNYAHVIVHCFLLEQILSCPVRTRPDWIDWYFQTIARVKNRSCFRIMAVTMGGTEFLSSLNKTWRQFSQFNLSQRAPKIYPWLRPVAITCERSMCPFQICAYLWIFRLFMKRHFFGTMNWGEVWKPLFSHFSENIHLADARKLLENNFSILSLTFCVSNSDVQRVLMISRVFAITRFLQKRSNKPRLLMIPMCLMIAGLLSTSFLLLLALSTQRGETYKDVWTREIHKTHNLSLFFLCQVRTTITFYYKTNIS